jgi:hypothetical protein
MGGDINGLRVVFEDEHNVLKLMVVITAQLWESTETTEFFTLSDKIT